MLTREDVLLVDEYRLLDYDPEPRLTDAEIARAKEILAENKLVQSARFDATLNYLCDLSEKHNLTSVVVRVPSGHIAASEQARYIALARRAK